MERLQVDEQGVSERQGNVDIPTPREPSRTTWMRQQYLAADRTEHEIRAERRAFNSPTPLSPTAPYYPGYTLDGPTTMLYKSIMCGTCSTEQPPPHNSNR